jgi:hypothetical protein
VRCLRRLPITPSTHTERCSVAKTVDESVGILVDDPLAVTTATLRFSRRALAASSRRTPEFPINKIAARAMRHWRASSSVGVKPPRSSPSHRASSSARTRVHRSVDNARSTCTSTSRVIVAGSVTALHGLPARYRTVVSHANAARIARTAYA